MTPILRVDGTTLEIVLGLARGCTAARLTGATLTVQLAGVWPRVDRTYVDTMTDCGVTRVPVDTPFSPPTFTMTAVHVNEQWQAVFEPHPDWLAAPDGRYDGTLTSECGAIPIRFQKGAFMVARNATAAPLPCGDAGAVCDPPPPHPPLSVPSFTALYRLSGWTRYPEGHVFHTDVGPLGQEWPTVEAPYDTLGAEFQQWSDGVLTRSRPPALIVGDLDVSAQYTIPNVSANYFISGHGTIPNGLLTTSTVQAFQTWPTVTAPADDSTTAFAGWSDGVLTRARNDGQAAVNRPDVTALYQPIPAAAIYRLDFESPTLPSGFTTLGMTRASVGGTVCEARELHFAAGGSQVSTALGQSYAYSTTGMITIETTNPAFNGWLSFFYNANSSVLVSVQQTSGVWQDWTLSPTPVLAQTCSRNYWQEVRLPIGPARRVIFEGEPSDFAVDNVTLGHNDPLGPLP